MKKLNKFFTLLVIALTGLSLTACSDGDDLSTDQYGNDINLNAFGPSPVLRGGTLYFYGSNLDQITEVDLPGADPITSIEVLQSGVPSKISITVPAEKCDTGRVVLKTAKGGTITSISPVTYREDIEFDKFYVGSEGTLVGSVGDVLTIKGDYLNLMHGVIFTENDTIAEDQFLSHDRYTITLAIPVEAKTGTIKLTDLAEEPSELESKEALTINLPEVSGVAPETIKAGATLTIKGSSLDQIASAEFTGATVEAADFLSQGATEITIAVPVKATDGEVTLVTKSGVEIAAGSITTVVPSELKATPDPVKNGATLTISGKDLDLVTGVAFPEAEKDTTWEVKSATQLTAIVPITAQEGDITLSLANGKSVTVAYTLVNPTVTSCNPSSLIAGEKVIISGTDLDLVASIVFPGDAEQTVSTFAAQNVKVIGLTVPTAAYGNDFKLVLKNGTTVEAKGVLSIQAATDPAINEDPASGKAGTSCTLKGKNFNNVESVYIGETKMTKFSEKSNTSMTFTIPATMAGGTYDLIMYGPDGTKYVVGSIVVSPAEVELWSGKVGPTNWSGDKVVTPSDMTNVDQFVAGKTVHFALENDPGESYWQIEICGSWWTGYPSFYNKYGGGSRIQLDTASLTECSFEITDDDVTIFNQQNGFLFVGNGVYVTRIYITD